MAGDPEMGVPYAECEEMCYFFSHLYPDQFGKSPGTGSGTSRESRSILPRGVQVNGFQDNTGKLLADSWVIV